MRAPPLLVGSCAVLWGVQTGHWLIAVALAVLVELHRVIRTRWEVVDDDVRKLATVCNVAMLLVFAFFVTTGNSRNALPQLLQWLPIIVLPILLAVHFSAAGRVNPAALFLALKRRDDRERQAPTRVALDYPFAVVTLIAASAANHRTWIFFAALAFITGWALWTRRSMRVRRIAWLFAFTTALGLGWAGHTGLNALQHWLVGATIDFFSGSRTDPYRHTTQLGHIGTLKLSDHIIVRVATGRRLSEPLLLHRASYNDYVEQTWIARRARLQPLPTTAGVGRWRLAAGSNDPITITTTLDEGLGVLALPLGVAQLASGSPLDLQHNRLGTVRVEGDPGLLSYRVTRGTATPLAQAPDDHDLKLPDRERELLESIAAELQLRPDQAAAMLDDYFAPNFRYSLYRETESTAPLADFLTRDRSGHCEYFATATVLLLRAAGVPARFATGFSVQEYSELEGQYRVRLRHAHAWARAWINERWVDIDTTPPAWYEEEAQTASFLEPVKDLWSWAWHRFSMWRLSSRESGRGWMLWVAVALVGYLVVRMRRPSRRKADAKGREPEMRSDHRPTSPLAEVEDHLARQGLGRRASETMAAWIRRLVATDPSFQALEPPLALHLRLRFGPPSASRRDWDRLQEAVDAWLDRRRQDR